MFWMRWSQRLLNRGFEMRRFWLGTMAALALSTAAEAGPKEEMMAADKAFNDMSLAKGAHTAFLAYMTDDVLLFDGDHPPIIGKKAAAAFYADQEKKNPNYKTEKLSWVPLSAEASKDGSIGYTRGTWKFAGNKKDGGPANFGGYYVTGWRKQADGTYKFMLDIGGETP